MFVFFFCCVSSCLVLCINWRYWTWWLVFFKNTLLGPCLNNLFYLFQKHHQRSVKAMFQLLGITIHLCPWYRNILRYLILWHPLCRIGKPSHRLLFVSFLIWIFSYKQLKTWFCTIDGNKLDFYMTIPKVSNNIRTICLKMWKYIMM